MNAYNITDFGARVCDALQTSYIQKAIDTCFLNGGGRVTIPAGIFRTGGIRLRSNVTLYLETGAILEGSMDPEDYTGWLDDAVEPVTDPEVASWSGAASVRSRWNNAIIRAVRAKNIAIIGEPGSYINGRNCSDPTGEEGYRGPHAINMWYCENISLSGYTITDSANWAHAIFDSSNITARNLTVYGGHDGFDVRSCDNILIENCRFYTGDDSVAGYDNNDVIIRNCEFDCSCSALRFGGNHVLVENCHSHAPARFGHRYTLTKEKQLAGVPTDASCRHSMYTVFLYYCDFRANPRRTPGDILIKNCTFENPNALFNLQFDGHQVWCCNRSLAEITFENCRVTGVSEPVQIYGDEKEPLSFSMKNVTLAARPGFEAEVVIDARNFEKICLEDVTLEGYEKPAILCRTQGAVEIRNSTPVEIQKV